MFTDGSGASKILDMDCTRLNLDPKIAFAINATCRLLPNLRLTIISQPLPFCSTARSMQPSLGFVLQWKLRMHGMVARLGGPFAPGDISMASFLPAA